MKRLGSVGLSHLVIDLHGADLSPKKVMETVARTSDVLRAAAPTACDEVHNGYVDHRNCLNQHDERMHMPQAPAGRLITVSDSVRMERNLTPGIA